MTLQRVARTWEALGRDDPFWAVLTEQDRRDGKWEPEAFFATGVAEVKQLAVELERLGLRLGGGRALDFGCGVGRITQALGERFEQVDGVDISAPMLEQARRFNAGGEDCRFTENRRTDLRLFPDGHFDFIYSRIVLQHMPARMARRYLAEFCRVLRPGGVLYFQIPAGWNLSSPVTHELLRHHVTKPRRIYKALRRLVMLDWSRSPEWHKQRRQEMEMHFCPLPEVVRLLERHRLVLSAIQRDDACGEAVLSYNYLAVKSPQSAAKLHSDWAWRKLSWPK